jgi:amino acid adenylation domain-containing protein
MVDLDSLKNLTPKQRDLLLRRLSRERAAAAAQPEPERIPRRALGCGDVRLSFAQERMWFLHQLDPESSAYNISSALHARGYLDLVAFSRSLAEIVRRHEALRTVFTLEAGQPRQRILPEAPPVFTIVDLATLPEKARSEERDRLAQAEASRPFDLARGPLLRILLVRLGPAEQRTVFTLHHIVADGWSVAVMIREFAAFYRAFASGGPSPLPELPVQYADYSEWQRGWLCGEALERELAHWRQTLAGAPALIELPTDHPRPAVQRFHGRILFDAVDAEGTGRFQALCRSEGVTLFMGLLAAFQALLSRHGAGTDLVVGTPVAGRDRVELEGLIGLFLNTLPLRSDLKGDPDVRELLARTRRVTLAAFSHQDLPFGRLVEELVSERNLGHAPIYQVLLVLQNASGEKLDLPGIEVELVRLQEEGVKLDLSLSVEEERGGLVLRWPYNIDLFDAATVARLSRRLQVLMAAMADETDRRLSELDLLTREESQQLLEWNDTIAMYAQEPCLHELVEAQVACTPDRLAVTFAGRSLTYRGLNVAAERLARRLRRLGVGPEILVGVCAERSLEMVVALLAILKAGGAYLPLDPEYPAERLRFMLEDARVPVVLLQESVRGVLPPHSAALVSLDGLVEESGEGADSDAKQENGASPGHLAYVIYTSGSTGRPKGAMNSHRGIVNRLLWMQERYGLTGDDRVLQKTPFSFDVSVWEFFWPLLTGARLVMARPGGHRDSAYLVETVVTDKITTLHFVPSMLQVFLEASGVERCTGLRRVLCSGEALPQELERRASARLPKAELHNLYGPTEAAVDVTSWACEPGDARVGVPIGRPVANTRIHVVDGGLRLVPMGVPGELLIGGVQVGRGYLARPDLTAERFIPDPFSGEAGLRLYRTGDLVRLLPDGVLDFLGRIDHQVKVRGLRIELGEIEAALAALPAVREAVVMARSEGGALGAVNLVAYITLRQGEAEPAPEEVRRALAQSLPEYMIPSALIVLDAMPLTASGKVDRKALPAPDRATASAIAWEAPRNPLERDLAQLWSEVLDSVEEGAIGIHDSFFELGGNSITGAIFINRLQERLGEIVHVVTLFDAPTLARLAERLAAEYPRAVRRIWGAATLEAYGISTERQVRQVDEEVLAEVARLLPERRPGPAGLKNPRAIFVLSPPRSGSTLLRVMLGGHPGMFAPPELELLHFATLLERRDAFTGRDAFRLEGLPRAVMEARSCDAIEAQELVTGWEDSGLTTREAYRRIQEWIGGRLLVDKTPTYAWSPGALREAEVAFDSPLYIHLLRHPYGMIHSFEEARVEQVFFHADVPFDRQVLAEAGWVLAHRNILEFLAGVPGERRLTVLFEDLVREPESELRCICDFVGIGYHPDMAEPYRRQKDRMTDGLHRESRMLGDVKFHRHSGVDSTTADRWRGWVQEEFLGEPARALAASLGYQTEPAGREAWTVIPRRSTSSEPLPLSFSQERMWFLHQLDPGSSVYNICGAVRLQGVLDAAVLERCFAEVVRRHEALRTTFAIVDGQPMQKIDPPSGPALPLVDLSALPADARADRVLRLAEEERSRPFDLLRGPVCRFTLVRLDPGDHAVLLTIHHASSDGWSLGLLVRELTALYETFAAGEASPLPELPIQYADFALWQRSTLQGETLDFELDWWRNRLAGELPPLRVPSDRRRSSVRGFKAEALGLELPPDLVRGLQELAQRSAASLYMILLAAWKGLLARLTGEEDVIIGAPTASRTRPELENLIGFFLNTLVLRTDLSGDPTFREALTRVRETTLGAFAHQDIPLQMVLQAAQPDREWAQTTPFQVMFLLQNLPPRQVSVPGMTFSPLEAGREIQDLGTAIFEVGLMLVEAEEGGLGAHVTYNGLLFDPSTMARLLERYRRILAATVADPGRSLWSYELMSAEERAEVIALGEGEPAPRADLVHQLFEAVAATAPDSLAVIADGRALTYGELDRRSNQLAHRLRDLGVGPEEVVGLALDRSPELIVAMLAVLKAGGAYVPLEPTLPGERLGWILEDAAARVVLSRASVLATQSHLADGRIRVIDLDAEAIALSSLPTTSPRVKTDTDNLAYVIFTSGSTGRPKGVMVRHGSLATYVAGFREEHGLGARDVVLQFASIGFDTSAEEIYPSLTSGAVLALRDDAMLGSARDFLSSCSRLGVTVLDLPTAFWHQMVARLADEPLPPPPALRLIILGGERILPERLDAWHTHGHHAIRLVNTYGPTETTIVATRRELPAGLTVPSEVPIGRPVPGAWTRVLDPHEELAPSGIPGELCVGGVGLARGYLGRPDLTAERFVPDPWSRDPGARLYRTGDLVRLLPSGDLEFLGRIDHQVKVRGYRVELREVEATLTLHPEVAEAVVEAREDIPGEQRLAAYVVLHGSGAPPDADLRAFLRERLPDYMVPAHVVFLPALPLTPSGKVDRRALPAPERARVADETSWIAPRTEAEEMVAAIWAELLGLQRISATDNFFELGGHSLLLPQVMYRLRTAFQIDIPLRALLDEPTVEGLALTVEEILLAEMEGEESFVR